MHLCSIHTDADYKATPKSVAELINMFHKRDTPDADRLETLGTALQACEARHVPLELPDSVEAEY